MKQNSLFGAYRILLNTQAYHLVTFIMMYFLTKPGSITTPSVTGEDKVFDLNESYYMLQYGHLATAAAIFTSLLLNWCNDGYKSTLSSLLEVIMFLVFFGLLSSSAEVFI